MQVTVDSVHLQLGNAMCFQPGPALTQTKPTIYKFECKGLVGFDSFHLTIDSVHPEDSYWSASSSLKTDGPKQPGGRLVVRARTPR